MAKKRKKTQAIIQIETLPSIIRNHIFRLGFTTVEEYKSWCRNNNFTCNLHKDSRQRRNELSVKESTTLSELFTNEKKTRDLKELIPKIYNQEIQANALRNPTAISIASAFENSAHPKVLLNFLLYLGENCDLLNDPTYINGLVAIANHSEEWIRPIETWHVKRHNRHIQFTQLLRHLFAAYEIPAFMDQVWLTDNVIHQNWYKHIGSGQNIRTAPNIPLSLTKKMAHHFLNAPKEYNVDEALIWGQVHALGGDQRLMDALRGTKLIKNHKNNEFWLNVIRFFITNPMLDVSHVHPIIDFIWNQKFQNQRVFVARDVVEEHDPPQPNFSMKGRTPNTLLRQVSDWHDQLGRETRGGDYTWCRSSIGEFQLKERGYDNNKLKHWIIKELLSTKELIDEGRKMKHCVITYARSCYVGKTSIWTMKFKDETGQENVLTIEVSLEEKLIKQVRGKRNRLPTIKEKGVLSRWAKKEKLEIAEYVKFERD